MRLLKLEGNNEFSLTRDTINPTTPYAILSHTWGDDNEEVSFRELEDGSGKTKDGYKKIRFCGEQAARDDLQYFWVDTCCIDKSNSTELSEAINSMFRWYRDAAKCYVYLADVPKRNHDEYDDLPRSTWKSDFRNSRWFTRGWTLQELIAPASVEFFSHEGIRLGDKRSMGDQISEITNIPAQALQGGSLSSFSVDERMSWGAKRNTARKEDGAYCLLGIFDIYMPLIYGEREQAFSRLRREIDMKGVARAQGVDDCTMLRSDSIFPYQRLLVRDDVESFLTNAFCQDGVIRAVLHGLPGAGKSTMARHFAYKNRGEMAILWIPANSESKMIEVFEEYAEQISGEDGNRSEPVSVVGRLLSERFPGKWLVVFDGLDDPSINIHRYLFADLPNSKILVTTRRQNLASQIGATHPLPVNPLDENAALDLLSTYIVSKPSPAIKTGALQKEITFAEREARKSIVKGLGGLPLAISIIGASMREDNGILDCQSYLTWSDEAKDVLLEEDHHFSDFPYSSSVWKAFTFAFQQMLSGAVGNYHTESVANFIASCENSPNIAGYVRLFRLFKRKRSRNSSGLATIDQIRFLENGFFETTVAKLAAANMVTLNRTGNSSESLPYIEMHALVRRWIERKSHDKILSLTAPKIWLLGFGIYDQIIQRRIGPREFEPLMKEIKASLSKRLDSLQVSSIPRAEIVFPFLLEAQENLLESIAHLPAGPEQRGRLREFREELESEITESYENALGSFDWLSMFQEFVRELKEQIEYAVKSDARSKDYKMKDFFLETLDSHGCIPIAFKTAAPSEMSDVGATALIQDVGEDITAKTKSMLEKSLSRDSIKEVKEIAIENSNTSIRQWTDKWDGDVTEVVRRSLNEVFAARSISTVSKGLGDELSLTSDATPEDNNIGSLFQTMTNSSDPRNAFFALLRQAVKAATEHFLTSSPAVDILDAQQDTFMNECESSIRGVLGDRAQEYFHAQSISSEAGKTVFSMLWQLAWPARFPGGLEDLIAQQVVDSISNDLKNAAQMGFVAAFGNETLGEDLAEEVFNRSCVSILFPNWISSGWIDLTSDDENESNYTHLMGGAQVCTLNALQALYDNDAEVFDHDLALQALQRTFECRKTLHDTVMNRLNQPNLTDRTGMGAFFAKMSFEDCDKDLRLIYSILGSATSKGDLATLESLVDLETKWKFGEKDWKTGMGRSSTSSTIRNLRRCNASRMT